MKQENSWQDKPEVKRGNVGENIVKNHFESLGYIIYEPITNGAHPFDKFVAHSNKKDLFILEVKTKPARIKYPDTGIDISAYNGYKYIVDTYRINIFLVFVDDLNKSVYGNWITELDKPYKNYPLETGGIIYWHIGSMTELRKLTDTECDEIRKYYTGNYNLGQ